MSAKNRIKLSKYEFATLISEVDGVCPLCSEELITLDNNRQAALSQAAHIYPHSPSPSEMAVLHEVPKLSDDDESIENLIMLCPNCHSKFDHPRTKEGYMNLYALKNQLTKRRLAREHYRNHNIEEDIISIFQHLGSVDIMKEERKLSYNAITVNSKMNKGASLALKNIVARDVYDYYISIHDALEQLEHDAPGKSDLIAKEIALFYSSLKVNGFSQDEIYYSINEWLDIKTQRQYTLLTPFITAFYIQNCEVFS